MTGWPVLNWELVSGSGVEVSAVAGMTGVYECTLPENLRVAVQPGDILGIDLPGSNEYKFRIYFDDCVLQLVACICICQVV